MIAGSAPVSIRLALARDIPTPFLLAKHSIAYLLKRFLSPAQLAALFDISDINTQLIGGTCLVAAPEGPVVYRTNGSEEFERFEESTSKGAGTSLTCAAL